MLTILLSLITIFAQQTTASVALSSVTCDPSATLLPCSSISTCECFKLANNNSGICVQSTLFSCSMLPQCNINNTSNCPSRFTACVIDKRCNQPVCLDLLYSSPIYCPPFSTIVPWIPPTVNPLITTTTANPPKLLNITYPIIGSFDKIAIYGNKYNVQLMQLAEGDSETSIEIFNVINASSPVSINSVTSTLTLSNLNNLNVIVYFQTLKQIYCSGNINSIGTIDINNRDTTNITIDSFQQLNINGINQLNIVSQGSFSISNISSLGTINLIDLNGQLNITATGSIVNVNVTNGIPYISIKAKNLANITTNGISTVNVEAENLIDINSYGIDTIYATSSSSTMSVNMILYSIATIYTGVSDKKGTKVGYSCPKTVNMSMSFTSTVYVCATEKINVNGYGGTVYYQGTINDSRQYGSKIPF